MNEEAIAFALSLLAAPRGAEPGAAAARDEALRALLAAPEATHPRLLALAGGSHPPPLVLLALARFGRKDSVPALAAALAEGDAPTAVIAARALALHPAPAARLALERVARGEGFAAQTAARMLAQEAVGEDDDDSSGYRGGGC